MAPSCLFVEADLLPPAGPCWMSVVSTEPYHTQAAFPLESLHISEQRTSPHLIPQQVYYTSLNSNGKVAAFNEHKIFKLAEVTYTKGAKRAWTCTQKVTTVALVMWQLANYRKLHVWAWNRSNMGCQVVALNSKRKSRAPTSSHHFSHALKNVTLKNWKVNMKGMFLGQNKGCAMCGVFACWLQLWTQKMFLFSWPTFEMHFSMSFPKLQ